MMKLTKIPTAITDDDRTEHFVYGISRETYTVEDSATHELLAAGLTKRETIEFTWLSNGRDYEIKPRMCTLHDDQGKDTGLTIQLFDVFGTEWDVYFKDGHDLPWRKSRITAYGETERAALIDLIDEGFRREAWSDAYYVHQIGITDMRAFYAEFVPPKTKRALAGA